MLKIKFTAILLIAFLLQVNAQEFLTPSHTFSHKKTSYVTLKDGTEKKGTLSDLDYKKGLIKSIAIVDETGKKLKLKAQDVSSMYLAPSGLDNLAKATNFLSNAQKWNNDKLNQDFLSQGYVYFENTDVKIKKKVVPMLMQLLNPDFSKHVKVYHDPLAKQTTSVGIGGVTLAGGDAKSYYVKIEGENTANLLTKKDYKKEFKPFWTKCSAVTEKFVDVKWTDLPKHIVEYTETCGK